MSADTKCKCSEAFVNAWRAAAVQGRLEAGIPQDLPEASAREQWVPHETSLGRPQEGCSVFCSSCFAYWIPPNPFYRLIFHKL